MRSGLVNAGTPPARFIPIAVAILMLGLVAWRSDGQVDAHAEFDHSNPAPGSTVDAPPAIVEAWFTEDLDSNGTTMTVTGPDGATVDKGDAAVDLYDPERRHLTVSLMDGLGPGVYTVTWTSVSSEDGDTATGDFQFTVAGNASPCPGASPIASPAVATPDAGTPVATACPPVEVDAGFGTPAAVDDMLVTLATDKAKAGPVTLTITLTDPSGASIDDASVHLQIKSIEMDMGTSERDATSAGHGQYVTDANMGMGGKWQVDVQVTRPGQPPVVARFTVELSGLK